MKKTSSVSSDTIFTNDIDKLKHNSSSFYKAIGSIWCPAMKDNITFNNHGWIHIRYNNKGKRRQSSDISLRFKLLRYVPQVIKDAKIVIKKTDGRIISRKGIARKVIYYEIASKIDNGVLYVTVILRKIEDGKLHYYSVRRTSSKIKKTLTGLH